MRKNWKVRVTKYVNDFRYYTIESIYFKTKKEAIKELDTLKLEKYLKEKDDDDVIWSNVYETKDNFEIIILIDVACVEPNEIKIVGELIKE